MASKQSKKRNQVYGDDDHNKADPKKRAHVIKTRSMTKYDRSTIKDLPQEFIMEIFSRLPWLSIMKLSLVFPSIMQRPEFERMCFQSPRRTTSFVASSENNPTTNTNKQYQIIEYHHSDHQIVSTKLDFTKLFREHENSSKSSVTRSDIVKCCNGLLLLSTIYNENNRIAILESLHLVNPITRSSVKLPHYFKHYYRKYGLGYSSNTRLYKVVDLIFDTNCNSVKVLTVDLNNAETNYCWRSCSVTSKKNGLTCDEFLRLVPDLGNPLPLNGAIHWLTTKRAKLLRFHVDEEEFDLVPLPEHGYGVSGQLSALGGSICVLKGSYTKSGFYMVTVWVMKEYGVKDSSWSRLRTIITSYKYNNLGGYSCRNKPRLHLISVNEDDNKVLLREGALLRLYDYSRERKWYNEEVKCAMLSMN